MPDVVIIGGGIAGLATAFRLQTDAAAARSRLRLHLIEASPRFGGKIVSERADGFLIEGGPDSIVAHKPQALELIRELGLGGRLLPSNDARRGVRLLRGGRWVDLPEGLQLMAPRSWGEFLSSPILPWPAKLRFALERWVPPRRGVDDESVADFVGRRFGEGALWGLAEPLLAHLHVGDVERMSLRATWPRLAELEAQYGSVHRGVAALRAKQRESGGPAFWTLEGGLAELVDALVERLEPGSLHTGRKVVEVRRHEDAYAVRLDDGRELAADAVVLATPTADAADVVAELDPDLAAKLRAIRYASMATLSLGFRAADVAGRAGGFGFFVPRREKRRVLAGSWTSVKFDRRAPEGTALLRLFLGGATDEGLLELDDDALIRTARDDLETMMGLDAEPTVTRLYRWPRGYPQYQVGHPERVREIEATLPPGLFLAGSAWHGVGLPDCVASGSEAARRILEDCEVGPAG